MRSRVYFDAATTYMERHKDACWDVENTVELTAL